VRWGDGSTPPPLDEQSQSSRLQMASQPRGLRMLGSTLLTRDDAIKSCHVALVDAMLRDTTSVYTAPIFRSMSEPSYGECMYCCHPLDPSPPFDGGCCSINSYPGCIIDKVYSMCGWATVAIKWFALAGDFLILKPTHKDASSL